ncbi:hypothetical protein Tco_1239066 [Tanacetum coccineum]
MALLHRPFTGKSIKEIHEGSCGFNAEPRSMVVKVTKQVRPLLRLIIKFRNPFYGNEGDRGVMKVSALNWNISVRNMTKKETWNQDLFESGKPLQFSARSLQGPGDRERVLLSYPSQAQGGNPSFVGTSAYYPYGGYVSHAPMINNIPAPHGFMYPSADPSNNYPLYWMRDLICLLDQRLSSNRQIKMPSYMGSYDEKGDPNNYLHLFEGVIRMMKWAMLVACHMFTYTLKDSVRIWWNGQKACSILNYKDLKAEYTYDTLQILGLREKQRIFGFVHGLKTRSLVEFLSTDLQTTYKGLMEKTYTWIEVK